MLKSRFSEKQIISILAEQKRGMSTSKVCRRHGMSSATFYKYKSHYDDMTLSDAKRLKSLQEENSKLKRLLANAMLDNAARDKKLLTPDVKRKAVRHVIEAHGLSERRACRLAELDRSTFQYQKQTGRDETLRQRLRELAAERLRFGYRHSALSGEHCLVFV